MKTFVLTGDLSNRKDIKQRIIESGGLICNSVNINTDFLVCGKMAGSKLLKAKILGVKVISEHSLNVMLFGRFKAVVMWVKTWSL